MELRMFGDQIAGVWGVLGGDNRRALARYHRGVDDSTTLAAVEALHAPFAEVGGREARLAGLGAKNVTRPLAEKCLDLRPLMALFSERHALFGDSHHGR